MYYIFMCLAYPGKIESIDGDRAVIDFGGIKKEANVSLADVKEGDYVMVHAGFAIEKVTNEDAWTAIRAYHQSPD